MKRTSTSPGDGGATRPLLAAALLALPALLALAVAIPDPPRACAGTSPVDPPPGLDEETLRALHELDHPDWQRREAASAWLVEHAPRWARRIPVQWDAGSPEARWRWQRVRELVESLESLPSALLGAADPRTEARIAQLREETGSAFLDALERCLGDADARVRSEAVERLGETLAGRHRLVARPPAADPSPRVLERLYELARRHDREWALALVTDALAREDSPITIAAAAEGARRLGDPRLLPELRRHFRGAGEPNPEIVIALAAFAHPEDADAVDWLLRSPEYRHVSLALDSLGAAQVRRHESAIESLLASEHWDLRVRALRRFEEEEERAAVAYRLLGLLEHPDEEVYLFAVENLLRLGGEDFVGDIEVSLRRFPLGRRPFAIVIEEGRPVPRAILPRDGAVGEPVPAIEPGLAPVPRATDR